MSTWDHESCNRFEVGEPTFNDAPDCDADWTDFQMPPEKPGPVFASTPALLSLVLWFLSWELTFAMLGGRWLFGPQWFGLTRELAALAASVALSIYHFTWGRARMYQYVEAAQRGDPLLTWRQSALVTAIFILFGAFLAWLFTVA